MPFLNRTPQTELLEAPRGVTFRRKVQFFEDAAKTKPLNLTGLSLKLTIAGYLTLTSGAGLIVNAVAGEIEVVLTPSQTTSAPAAQARYSLTFEEGPEEVVCPLKGVMTFPAVTDGTAQGASIPLVVGAPGVALSQLVAEEGRAKAAEIAAQAAAEAAAEAELDALSHVKPLGEVEGVVTPNLAEGSVFTLTLKGNTTIEKPTNWPVGTELTEALLVIKQPPAGGKTITFGAGITPVGGALNPEPNAVSLFSVISTDNGTTVYAVNAVEGKVGATGTVGPAAWSTIAAWESGKAYVVGPPASIVSNAGSCFVCIVPITGATPPGEDGTHWAKIAEKGTTGAVGPGGPPGATGATKALGNVTGTIKLNLAEALAFTMTAIGNLTVEFENWPAGLSEPELYITEDATGGRTITIPGVTWQNETPEFFTTANALNIIPLSSPDGGAHIYGIRGQRGATGSLGPAGPTGPEGKAGAWTAITLNTPKMGYIEGEFPKTEARSEQGGSRGVLRGNLEVRVGEELKAGETLLTLPEGLRPTKTITRLCGAGASITAVPALNLLKISSAGVVTLGAALTAGKVIHLDEISWSLT